MGAVGVLLLASRAREAHAISWAAMELTSTTYSVVMEASSRAWSGAAGRELPPLAGADAALDGELPPSRLSTGALLCRSSAIIAAPLTSLPRFDKPHSTRAHTLLTPEFQYSNPDLGPSRTHGFDPQPPVDPGGRLALRSATCSPPTNCCHFNDPMMVVNGGEKNKFLLAGHK